MKDEEGTGYTPRVAGGLPGWYTTIAGSVSRGASTKAETASE